MKRIVVTGPIGAGKSGLARQLGQLLEAPVLHLDAMFWKPGWVPTPPDEWVKVQRRELAAEAWIAEGQFDDILPDWFRTADTVVFIDASPLRCLWRVSRRRLNRGGRVGTPAGTEPSRYDRALLKFLRNQWHYRRRIRRELLQELSRARNGRRTVVLRTGGDAARLLSALDSRDPAGGTF